MELNGVPRWPPRLRNRRTSATPWNINRMTLSICVSQAARPAVLESVVLVHGCRVVAPVATGGRVWAYQFPPSHGGHLDLVALHGTSDLGLLPRVRSHLPMAAGASEGSADSQPPVTSAVIGANRCVTSVGASATAPSPLRPGGRAQNEVDGAE